MNITILKWLCLYVVLHFFSATACLAEATTRVANIDSDASRQEIQIITIQVSSHKQAKDAEREKRRLQSHGLEVYIAHEKVKDKGMWSRVYAVQFESRNAANVYAKGLVDKKVISGFWVKKVNVPTSVPEGIQEKQEGSSAPAAEKEEITSKTETTAGQPTPPPDPVAVQEEATPPDTPLPEIVEPTPKKTTEPEAVVLKEPQPADPVPSEEKRKQKLSF